MAADRRDCAVLRAGRLAEVPAALLVAEARAGARFLADAFFGVDVLLAVASLRAGAFLADAFFGVDVLLTDAFLRAGARFVAVAFFGADVFLAVDFLAAAFFGADLFLAVALLAAAFFGVDLFLAVAEPVAAGDLFLVGGCGTGSSSTPAGERTGRRAPPEGTAPSHAIGSSPPAEGDDVVQELANPRCVAWGTGIFRVGEANRC